MAERYRIIAVAAKIETTPGVDAVPTLVANAVRPIGLPVLQINHLDEGSRADEQHAGLGDIGVNAASGRWGQIDIQLALKGAGADYSVASNRPEWDAFLQAAGFSAQETGGVGAGTMTYTTLDAGVFPTITLYLWSMNKQFKLTGVVCAPKITLEAAKRGVISFTCIGMIATDPTEATIAAQTLSNVIAPKFAGQTVSIGAFTSALTPPLIMRKFDLDFGTAHTPEPSAGAADGIAGFQITDRVLKATTEIEVVPLTSFNPYVLGKQSWPGGTDTSVSIQLGSVQFNTVIIKLGQFMFRAPKHADGSGLAMWTLDGIIAARSIVSGAGVGREIGINLT